MEPCLIGMEAYASARYRAHKLLELGHGETDRFNDIGRDRYILRVKGVQ